MPWYAWSLIGAIATFVGLFLLGLCIFGSDINGKAFTSEERFAKAIGLGITFAFIAGLALFVTKIPTGFSQFNITAVGLTSIQIEQLQELKGFDNLKPLGNGTYLVTIYENKDKQLILEGIMEELNIGWLMLRSSN